jgi:hypothetical protein
VDGDGEDADDNANDDEKDEESSTNPGQDRLEASGFFEFGRTIRILFVFFFLTLIIFIIVVVFVTSFDRIRFC